MKIEPVVQNEIKVLCKLKEQCTIDSENFNTCCKAIDNCNKIDSRSLLQIVINICNDIAMPLLDLFIDDTPEDDVYNELTKLVESFVTQENTITDLLEFFNQ